MRDTPKTGDPDFVEKMVRFGEEDRCRRALIPHLSDKSLLEHYQTLRKNDDLANDTWYITLLQLEVSMRILHHLNERAEEAKPK